MHRVCRCESVKVVDEPLEKPRGVSLPEIGYETLNRFDRDSGVLRNF